MFQHHSHRKTYKETQLLKFMLLLLLAKQLLPRFGHLPIVSNELYVMSLMALLNAVHTDGVAVCGVTGVTSERKGVALGMTREQSAGGGYGGRTGLER